MSDNRERHITEAFVSLATQLATGADVLDLVAELTTTAVQLLDVDAAGLLLADRRGVLHLLAASSDETRALETFQLQRDQGPCLECYQTAAPVLVDSLVKEADRWPQFALAALQSGYHAVHAVPLRLGSHAIGTLGLFASHAGAMTADDLRLGQALADVASESPRHVRRLWCVPPSVESDYWNLRPSRQRRACGTLTSWISGRVSPPSARSR